MWSNDRPTAPGFYWCHQRGKTRIVHIWCYKNGTELFTNEDGGASIKDALYDGAQWMAAVNPPNPQDQNESAQPAPKAVAYLDLGVGGYTDIGTDLTDEELATLPKGRHMLGIIGTYGVDGYAPAQPAPSFADAYQGAMEEVAIWRKRALEAEELNRKFVAEINGPVYMGEPAQPAPSVPTGWELVPVEVVALYRFMCSTFVPMTPQQKEIAKQFDLAKRAMAAAPEAKP